MYFQKKVQQGRCGELQPKLPIRRVPELAGITTLVPSPGSGLGREQPEGSVPSAQK